MREPASQRRSRRAPVLVAIVGGSGAGKSWLADRLGQALGGKTARVSLDDFYHDRSRVPPALRSRINFDHPRAIDWSRVERALRDLRAGRSARLPRYDFKTHCRQPEGRVQPPRPVILMDGLWLLRRPALRRLFALRIFIECPAGLRCRRRLARDRRSRGRTAESVRRQFRETVEPMHARFVTPQKRWATDRLKSTFGPREVRQLAQKVKQNLEFGI